QRVCPGASRHFPHRAPGGSGCEASTRAFADGRYRGRLRARVPDRREGGRPLDHYRGGDRRMLAICVESSHARGMGHLFRSAALAQALMEAGQQIRIYVNDHQPAIDELQRKGATYEAVPLCDPSQDWETGAVARDGIRLWVYDKHRTDRRSTARVKAQGVPIVTLDDRGEGAGDADLHIAALAFEPEEKLAGRRVL